MFYVYKKIKLLLIKLTFIGPRPEFVGENFSSEHGGVSLTLPCMVSEKWREEDSEDHFFKKFKKDDSSNLPCTSIPNVMESQSHIYKASDFTPAPKEDSKGKTCQEMVPFSRPISAASQIKKEIPLVSFSILLFQFVVDLFC